jgi:hypothetical protein
MERSAARCALRCRVIGTREAFRACATCTLFTTFRSGRPVASNRSHTVARLLWVFPAILLFLAVNQLRVAYGLRATLAGGEPAVAEIYEYHTEDRVDVTYDYVSLRVPLPDGRVIEREKVSLPHSLAPLLEGRESVAVRVRPGADQPVVIMPIVQSQWRIAAVNAAISVVGFLLLGLGVYAWNRYLRRQGDPADQPVAAASPAAQAGVHGA